jgi:hypothetical protein
MRRYRFFSRVATESGNAPSSHTLRFTEDAVVEIATTGDCAVGSFLGPAGRHAGPAAIHASRGLLLPLFTNQEPRKLREDVRAAEIRVALVGNVLRKIAKPLQRRESRRWAALAAQGSRRARPLVSPTPQEPCLSARWPDFGRLIGIFASLQIRGEARPGFLGSRKLRDYRGRRRSCGTRLGLRAEACAGHR